MQFDGSIILDIPNWGANVITLHYKSNINTSKDNMESLVA